MPTAPLDTQSAFPVHCSRLIQLAQRLLTPVGLVGVLLANVALGYSAQEPSATKLERSTSNRQGSQEQVASQGAKSKHGAEQASAQRRPSGKPPVANARRDAKAGKSQTKEAGAKLSEAQNSKQQPNRKGVMARGLAARLEAAKVREAAAKVVLKKLETSKRISDDRREQVLTVMARQRKLISGRRTALRQMAEERDRSITENKAYRAVSKYKSKRKAPSLNFSLKPRSGVTRGKKRGSEYFNKIIQKSVRNSGRGGNRGRQNRNY